MSNMEAEDTDIWTFFIAYWLRMVSLSLRFWHTGHQVSKKFRYTTVLPCGTTVPLRYPNPLGVFALI